MKKALILFPHGIGDVIMATPCLRALHTAGYRVDMIVRDSVIDSHLLDECPYTDKLIRTQTGGLPAMYEQVHMPVFNEIKDNYDWTGFTTLYDTCMPRIKRIAKELKLEPDSWELRVFLTGKDITDAAQYMKSVGLQTNEFIFVHTHPELHPNFHWDCDKFIRNTFLPMPVVDTRDLEWWDRINVTFALAAMAKHRVLSLSVMVHACDAMGCVIDACNSPVPHNTCNPIRDDAVLRHFVKGKRV